MNEITTTRRTSIPAGSYTVFNALSYTSQLIVVSRAGAEVYTAPSAHYPTPYHLGSASLADVAAILAHERTVVYRFELPPAPVVEVSATVGKVMGRRLHIEMGLLKIADHYSEAGHAVGRPVTSLAGLSTDEYAVVMDYLYGSYREQAYNKDAA